MVNATRKASRSISGEMRDIICGGQRPLLFEGNDKVVQQRSRRASKAESTLRWTNGG
jgi:hypothetical protein